MITRRDFSKTVAGAGLLLATGSRGVLADAHELIRRPIPSSGEMIPIVGVGTNRYGVGRSEDARAPLRESLSRFHELGGTVVDTAPMYRTSETVLGDLIAELGIREDLFIATKADRSGGREETLVQMQESTQKLRTDVFDAMQVHNLRGWQFALPLMREWKEEGRIRHIGITTSRAEEYEEFEKVMRGEVLDFIQVNYSLEQQESAKRILPLAAERGIAVIVNRGFARGQTFKKVGDMPVPDWAREFADSWAQFFLKYALSHPAATVAIPGMTKVRHVEDNMGAARGRMPTAAEREKMASFYADL